MANFPEIATVTTILHVSDPQFGKNHRFGSDEDLDTLCQRLEHDLLHLKKDYSVWPDLVVVTGDLAQEGEKEEFSEAQQFLERLSEILGLPRNHIAIVPGNHDIHWGESKAHLLTTKNASAPYWPKWKYWTQMFRKFYREYSQTITFTKHEPWTLFELPRLKVVVAGLNSTYKENHEYHRGFLTERQLRWFSDKLERYKADGWLRVGAIHHNIIPEPVDDSSSLHDLNDLKDILGPYLNIVLHGHTHHAGIQWLTPHVPIVAAGSAGLRPKARPNEVPNQYQILRLSRGHLVRFARHYDPSKKKWIGDTRLSDCGSRWIDEKSVDFQDVRSLGLHEEVPLPGPRVALSCLAPEVPTFSSISWSPDWQYFATGHTDGSVRLWESSTGRETRLLKVGQGAVWKLSFAANSRLLAAGSEDGLACVWEADSGNVVFSAQYNGIIKDIVIISEGQLALMESSWSKNQALIVDLVTGNVVSIMDVSGDDVSTIALSPTGRHLATVSSENLMRIWNLEKSELEHTLQGSSSPIVSLGFSADNQLLASGTKDGQVIVWSVEEGREMRRLRGGMGAPISRVVFSPEGRFLAALVMLDHEVKLWDVKNNFEDLSVRKRGFVNPALAFSRKGLYLALASEHYLQLWNLTLRAIDID